MRTRVLHSRNFPFYPALSEAGTHQHACQIREFFFHILLRDIFAVDELDLHFHVIVGACQGKTLPDTLVSVLKVVFPHQAHAHFCPGCLLEFQKMMPRLHVGSFAHRHAEFAQDGGIQSLALHVDRHLIDARQILALHHALKVHIAERGHFLAYAIGEVLLRAQDEHVRLYAGTLHLLHGVLRGLRLQLVSGFQIWHVCEVYTDSTIAQLPFQLADCLQKRGRLDIADSTSDFRNHKVDIVLAQHPALDFIGDMGNHLDSLAQIVTMTLLVDNRLVDFTRSDRVVVGGPNTRKALVMPQVQVRLHAVHRHKALPMFVGVQRAGVDIDVRVEFLDGDRVTAGLQQLADAGRNNALAQ